MQCYQLFLYVWPSTMIKGSVAMSSSFRLRACLISFCVGQTFLFNSVWSVCLIWVAKYLTQSHSSRRRIPSTTPMPNSPASPSTVVFLRNLLFLFFLWIDAKTSLFIFFHQEHLNMSSFKLNSS